MIRLEKTPRLPVSLLSAGAWTLNQSGLTLEQALTASPSRIADTIAQTNERAGCDIVWPGSGYHNLAIRGAGGKIKFRVKGTPDVQEPLLQDLQDISRVRLGSVREDPGIVVLAGAARLLVDSIGTHTVVGTSQWAPFTLGGLAFGVERLMRSLHKDKAAAHAIMEFATELCLAYLEPFIEAGVSMISLADPAASGDLISRQQFEEFSLPYLTRAAGILKSRGIWITVHICGNTTNRLDLIPQSGADIMSVDYKVNLSDTRRILGSRIAFAGNLNPVSVMQKQSPEGVSAASLECIKSAAGGSGGYILMPGCDIPPSVPIENVQAMVRSAQTFTE